MANSLLHHELKYLGWIELWWWWFGVVWVVLIFLMKMDWCEYNLVSNPFTELNSKAMIGIITSDGYQDCLTLYLELLHRLR